MKSETIREKLIRAGLKVTPQRLAVLDAVMGLNHPPASRIIDLIKEENPNVAPGTIYKTLETYIEKGMINKVISDRDVARYDAIIRKHHHLFSEETDRMEDYSDEELDEILSDYFRKKKISNFKIEDIRLQLKGKFTK